MPGLAHYYQGLTPSHLNATREDFLGNGKIGRYVILCGSHTRCQTIATFFEDLTIKDHPRGHTLYLGNLKTTDGPIAIATISTGMGCPSMDIILNELLMLGAKRFLRIGTAGSLQPSTVEIGHLVVATGAVRDEHTSENYIGLEYPAIASWEFIQAIQSATHNLNLKEKIHFGIVHTKDSFYAREAGCSSLRSNQNYMESLKISGVLASEMECSHLFVLSSIAKYLISNHLKKMGEKVLAGAILSIIGSGETPITHSEVVEETIKKSVLLGLETIKQLYLSEK